MSSRTWGHRTMFDYLETPTKSSCGWTNSPQLFNLSRATSTLTFIGKGVRYVIRYHSRKRRIISNANTDRLAAQVDRLARMCRGWGRVLRFPWSCPIRSQSVEQNGIRWSDQE